MTGRWSRRSGHEESVGPDTLCIMAAAVRADRQGGGLAGQAFSALRDRATGSGLERVIAPVRPSLKTRYPLTPMEKFARWIAATGCTSIRGSARTSGSARRYSGRPRTP